MIHFIFLVTVEDGAVGLKPSVRAVLMPHAIGKFSNTFIVCLNKANDINFMFASTKIDNDVRISQQIDDINLKLPTF